MRVQSPVSRGGFSIRVSGWDVALALATPLAALWLRDAPVLKIDWPAAALYCCIAFAFSLLAFLVFRIRDGLSHFFSVNDAIEAVKAVLFAELMTCLVLFSASRLEGIPRTTPFIHALLLTAGLISVRAIVRMRHREPGPSPAPAKAGPQNLIAIGATKMSSLYIDLLRHYAPQQHRVLAVLDDRPEMMGRSFAGVRVLGPAAHLLPLIEEFAEHGMETHRVLVGLDADSLSAETLAQIRNVCDAHDADLQFIPALVGLERLTAPHTSEAESRERPGLVPSGYLLRKRALDFLGAFVFLTLLIQVFVLVTLAVLVDVGSPVLFWQRRIGRNGHSFQIYKFRTLRPSFDWQGEPLPEDERLSWVGRMLRKTRLDELPQLLNVIVGDMSLVGPRPLLPRDQPDNPATRLSVRPGITGWAQIHGGATISSDEKNKLDEWYVQHASFLLDLKIMAKTFVVLVLGGRRVGESRPERMGRDSPVQSAATKAREA